MSERNSGREIDTEVLNQLIESVVGVATKSAEASTAVATAIRNLEVHIVNTRTAAEASHQEVVLLKQRLQQVESVLASKQQTGLVGMAAAFGEAMKNPQTLIILASLIATLIGTQLRIVPVSANPPPIAIPVEVKP